MTPQVAPEPRSKGTGPSSTESASGASTTGPSPSTENASAIEEDAIPQPEDSEEIELKQDISLILEQKALLKKELKDAVPEGPPCRSLI